MNEYDISATLAARSDQLNAADLAEPIVVTVMGVKVKLGDDQPVALEIDGGRMPYKPCKGMRRLLAQLWGTDASQWIGRSMRLYCDRSVTYGGQTVGGIRISALSGIANATDVKIITNRGKFKVYPIAVLPDPRAGAVVPADTPAAGKETIAGLRQELSAQFKRLGFGHEDQYEWLKGNYPDPSAALRDPETIAGMIAMLEKLTAIPATDSDNEHEQQNEMPF